MSKKEQGSVKFALAVMVFCEALALLTFVIFKLVR